MDPVFFDRKGLTNDFNFVLEESNNVYYKDGKIVFSSGNSCGDPKKLFQIYTDLVFDRPYSLFSTRNTSFQYKRFLSDLKNEDRNLRLLIDCLDRIVTGNMPIIRRHYIHISGNRNDRYIMNKEKTCQIVELFKSLYKHTEKNTIKTTKPDSNGNESCVLKNIVFDASAKDKIDENLKDSCFYDIILNTDDALHSIKTTIQEQIQPLITSSNDEEDYKYILEDYLIDTNKTTISKLVKFETSNTIRHMIGRILTVGYRFQYTNFVGLDYKKTIQEIRNELNLEHMLDYSRDTKSDKNRYDDMNLVLQDKISLYKELERIKNTDIFSKKLLDDIFNVYLGNMNKEIMKAFNNHKFPEENSKVTKLICYQIIKELKRMQTIKYKTNLTYLIQIVKLESIQTTTNIYSIRYRDIELSFKMKIERISLLYYEEQYENKLFDGNYFKFLDYMENNITLIWFIVSHKHLLRLYEYPNYRNAVSTLERSLIDLVYYNNKFRMFSDKREKYFYKYISNERILLTDNDAFATLATICILWNDSIDFASKLGATYMKQILNDNRITSKVVELSYDFINGI